MDKEASYKTRSNLYIAIEALEKNDCYIEIIMSQIKAFSKNGRDRELAQIIEMLDLFIDLSCHVYKTLEEHYLMETKSKKVMQNLIIHLLSIFKSIIIARDKKDLIMLSDLLNYELLDNMAQWKIKILPDIKRFKKKQE